MLWTQKNNSKPAGKTKTTQPTLLVAFSVALLLLTAALPSTSFAKLPQDSGVTQSLNLNFGPAKKQKILIPIEKQDDRLSPNQEGQGNADDTLVLIAGLDTSKKTNAEHTAASSD